MRRAATGGSAARGHRALTHSKSAKKAKWLDTMKSPR